MKILNKLRLIRHAMSRRLDFPVGSIERKRWKLIMYSLAYDAEWKHLKEILKNNR